MQSTVRAAVSKWTLSQATFIVFKTNAGKICDKLWNWLKNNITKLKIYFEEFQKDLTMLNAYIEIICQDKVFANVKQFPEGKKKKSLKHTIIHSYLPEKSKSKQFSQWSIQDLTTPKMPYKLIESSRELRLN